MSSHNALKPLRITVIAADGLPKREVFRLPDPFAVITVDADQTHMSGVIRETLNPRWNESFYIDVKEASVITVHIFDQRKFKRRDQGFLGVANIRIADAIDLNLGGQEILTLDLEKSDNNLTVHGRLVICLSTTNLNLSIYNPGPSQVSGITGAFSRINAYDSSISINNPTGSGGNQPLSGQTGANASNATTRKSGGNRRAARAQIDLCEYCHQRPKFESGKKVHAYCGRACAWVAANLPFNQPGLLVSPPLNPPTNPPSYSDSLILPQFVPSKIETPPRPNAAKIIPLPVPLPGPTCQTPGCTSPVFAQLDGTPSNYCQMTHRKWGEQGCILCRAARMHGPSVLCQTCHTDATSSAPVIIKVPKDHKNYKSVESQFKQTWRHTTTCPEVRAVYKIIVTKASLRQYQQYLNGVEARGNFVAMGKSRGNENRRWHGTKRKCLLGDPGYTSFCTESGCSLCCIIKSSFDIGFFGRATGWGRFGKGIYTSSTSSKSNDYSMNFGINSELKALLLNKVVVGNGKKLINDDTSLTAPPPGFDSVLAVVAPGGSLNYDELVVYRNDAVRPSYLVMYKNP